MLRQEMVIPMLRLRPRLSKDEVCLQATPAHPQFSSAIRKNGNVAESAAHAAGNHQAPENGLLKRVPIHLVLCGTSRTSLRFIVLQ